MTLDVAIDKEEQNVAAVEEVICQTGPVRQLHFQHVFFLSFRFVFLVFGMKAKRRKIHKHRAAAGGGGGQWRRRRGVVGFGKWTKHKQTSSLDGSMTIARLGWME